MSSSLTILVCRNNLWTKYMMAKMIIGDRFLIKTLMSPAKIAPIEFPMNKNNNAMITMIGPNG